jgi:biopolymer transport protein ExbD
LTVPNWDVFHSDRMGISRGLSTEQVRAAVARGEVREDDLVRPAGSETAWKRIATIPALLGPEPPPTAASNERLAGTLPASAGESEDESWAGPRGTQADEPTLVMPPSPEEAFAPPSFDDLDVEDAASATQFNPLQDESIAGDFGAASENDPRDTYLDALVDDDDEDEDEDAETEAADLGSLDLGLAGEGRRIALPLSPREPPGEQAWIDEVEVDDIDQYDPLEEDEEAAEFTLARGATDKVEELDLAAMVDVAFQLVLFFLVTSTTVLFKTLEVPKPNPETASSSAAQGQGKSLEDLQQDYILVDIEPSGAFKIDHEPVAANMNVLVKRLREARQSTGRLSMLLTADAATLHKYAVLAYDAANEIGLRIAIARPKRE